MNEPDDSKFSARAIVQRIEQFEQRLSEVEFRLERSIEAGSLTTQAGLIVLNNVRAISDELKAKGVISR